MSDEMATLIAKKFIQRRDVKAQQSFNGDYHPVVDSGNNRIPFQMSDLRNHLNRELTFGHYLIDQEDKCKLFAFDIDLEQAGYWCQIPTADQMDENTTEEQFQSMLMAHAFNPRESWRERNHPSRDWTKYQLRMLVEKLSKTIKQEFDLPVASAYSGSKGAHVYAFTGVVDAKEAREAAELTLSLAGDFELHRGKNFFRTVDQTPLRGFPNMSIEIFPKQSSLEGKDLGNLMRLPLGKNQKTNDPTFFIDQRAPMGHLVPHPDPIALLKSGNPWA